MPYDYARDKPVAEELLRRLCIGALVGGIRFGPVPQLLITNQSSNKPPVRGQVYLNLESSWRIYPARPAALPRGETEIEEPDEAEALRQLCELRETVIANVELGTDAPDLLVTFADGRVFFLNGRHEQYESWQFGIAFAPNVGALIVACPGNQIAVWSLPEVSAGAPAV